MGQEERIQKAYRGLGGKRTFYDGMITCRNVADSFGLEYKDPAELIK